MNEKLVREGKYTFLRIETDPGFDGGFEVRMITNNQPELLLKLLVNRENGATYLDYNVTGLTSLASKEKEAGTFLFSVISGLEKLGEVLPEYLLSTDSLSLEPERIFIREETGQVYFCYLPGNGGCFQESVRALMEFFMRYSAPADPKEVLLLYGLYQKSLEETLLPGTLAEFWRSEKEHGASPETFPRVEDPVIEFPDEEIYAELGMERPVKEAVGLFGRKAAPESRTEHQAIYAPQKTFSAEPVSKGHAGKEKESGKRGLWILEKLRKTERTETSYEPEEEPKTVSGKVKALWKRHKGEVVIALVVVIGAILILIR